MNGIGDVGTDGIIEQLVETNDTHQAKAERQADGKQEKDTPDAQSKNDSGNQ
jgi:hypothetical protein